MTDEDNTKLVYSATITISKNNGDKLKKLMDKEQTKDDETERRWTEESFENDTPNGDI